MAVEIPMIKGDTRGFQLEFVQADGSTPYPLLATDIIRGAIKKKPDDKNSESVVFSTNYPGGGLAITDLPNGLAIWSIATYLTDQARAKPHCFGVELSRAGATKSNSGTVEVTAGSEIIQGTGLDLVTIKRGDVLDLTAAGQAGNQISVYITSVGGDGTELDPGAGNLRSDFTAWTDESLIVIAAKESENTSPDGMTGDWVFGQDVVT